MKIEVKKFWNKQNKCYKFYSVHGTGEKFNKYEQALRDEYIALGIIVPVAKMRKLE